MGRLRDLDDRWADYVGGERRERALGVALGLAVLAVILVAAVIGALRDGDGLRLAVLGAAGIVLGPLIALGLHLRGQRVADIGLLTGSLLLAVAGLGYWIAYSAAGFGMTLMAVGLAGTALACWRLRRARL